MARERPPEEFALAGWKPDFWSALDTYVRPAITCRVTLEIDLNQDVSGPQATTISTTVQQATATAQQATAQLSVGIAGIIRNAAAPAQTIPNAWILLDSSNITSISNSTGAFQFTGVSLGSHTLTVRAVGFAQIISTFNVPDSSGVYDISVTPL